MAMTMRYWPSLSPSGRSTDDTFTGPGNLPRRSERTRSDAAAEMRDQQTVLWGKFQVSSSAVVNVWLFRLVAALVRRLATGWVGVV